MPLDLEVDLLTALERTDRPVAEVIFFSLEDARQERQGLTGYPGARSVLADLYMSSLGHAIAKSGPLSQFVLGCFLLTGGYVEREVLERRFDARAAVALDDATGHCHEAADSDDPWTVARLALELEEIARRHGLVTRVEESATRTQHKAAAEHDAKQATEGVDTVRMLSPIVHDSQSYQDTRRSAEDAVQRGPADVASEESTEQLLRVSQAPEVFLPNGQGGRLVVAPIPKAFAGFSSEGHEAIAATARAWDLAQRRVSGELFPLFAANQRRGLRCWSTPRPRCSAPAAARAPAPHGPCPPRCSEPGPWRSSATSCRSISRSPCSTGASRPGWTTPRRPIARRDPPPPPVSAAVREPPPTGSSRR